MFQSTHPRGVRRIEAGIKVSHLKFQSTHPRGVRPSYCFYITNQDIIEVIVRNDFYHNINRQWYLFIPFQVSDSQHMRMLSILCNT